jgi:hypothetical protein
MIPVRVARSSTRSLPPSLLYGTGGSRDSITSHNSSLTNFLDILSVYPLPSPPTLLCALNRVGGSLRRSLFLMLQLYSLTTA